MITIKRHEDGLHTIDGLPFETTGFARYRKKTTALAVQMHEPFCVETLEGTMTGKAEDWLMVGVEGEMYPCDNEIFQKSYEPA